MSSGWPAGSICECSQFSGSFIAINAGGRGLNSATARYRKRRMPSENSAGVVAVKHADGEGLAKDTYQL